MNIDLKIRLVITNEIERAEDREVVYSTDNHNDYRKKLVKSNSPFVLAFERAKDKDTIFEGGKLCS